PPFYPLSLHDALPILAQSFNSCSSLISPSSALVFVERDAGAQHFDLAVDARGRFIACVVAHVCAREIEERVAVARDGARVAPARSEEHTSELQSQSNL